MDIYLGSLYVNSYNEFGRHWQVTIQADGNFRTRKEDISLFQVRNKSGQMVPLSTLLTVREIGGPISVTRYNLYTSAAQFNGKIAAGQSSGDAIKAINKSADETLPLSMRIEWTDLMFLQIRAGNTAIYVFILAVICVFLALSALYESWTLPLAVILVVPLCLLSSVAGVLFTSLFTPRDVNIFVQIGLVVLVGLACKNAILIVEFAKQLHQEGQNTFDATKQASRLRLAADLDDVVRLYFRSDAADDGLGRRGGNAPFARRRRLQWHARRHLVRHLPHARVFLRHPGPERIAHVSCRIGRGRLSPTRSAGRWGSHRFALDQVGIAFRWSGLPCWPIV